MIDYFTERGGLLCVPTHTWNNLGEDRFTLDMTKCESNLGAFPVVALEDGRGVRSENPSHSVVVFGDREKALSLIDGEAWVKTPTARDGFYTFPNDEDPDFFFDEAAGLWRMAVCRTDPETNAYRYLFFESERPFDGYRFVGRGLAGAETGGSFVRVEGELYFLCGNAFDKISDYRIYHRGGVETARFDHPDGGFRGWGTLIPVKMGSRTRYFWLTFDRHNGSDYNRSYGNLYCFEAF